MNIFNYLFYRISKVLNKNNQNVSGALYGFTLLIYLSSMLLFLLVLDVDKEIYNSNIKNGVIAIGIVIFVSSYLQFIYKNRYLKIEKRFENESKQKKTIRGYIIVAYNILTFLAFGLLL